MRLAEAIAILTSDQPSRYRFEREFAAAVFSGWLNAPNDPHASTTTLFAALNQGVLRLRQERVPPPNEWLAEVFEADVYLRLLNEVLSIPIFWQVEEHIGYNHCRYTADLVRFLVTFQTKSLDRRKRASLGKACEFINKHGGFVGGNFGFEKKSWCSISGHQLIWRDYKRTAAFQCVRFHSSKFDWYLDPRQPNFLDRLTETVDGRTELIRFFGESLDVLQRVRAVIDERAMTADDFIALPANLAPVNCRLPAMTANAYGKMAGYRRTSLSTEWT